MRTVRDIKLSLTDSDFTEIASKVSEYIYKNDIDEYLEIKYGEYDIYLDFKLVYGQVEAKDCTITNYSYEMERESKMLKWYLNDFLLSAYSKERKELIEQAKQIREEQEYELLHAYL